MSVYSIQRQTQESLGFFFLSRIWFYNNNNNQVGIYKWTNDWKIEKEKERTNDGHYFLSLSISLYLIFFCLSSIITTTLLHNTHKFGRLLFFSSNSFIHWWWCVCVMLLFFVLPCIYIQFNLIFIPDVGFAFFVFFWGVCCSKRKYITNKSTKNGSLPMSSLLFFFWLG